MSQFHRSVRSMSVDAVRFAVGAVVLQCVGETVADDVYYTNGELNIVDAQSSHPDDNVFVFDGSGPTPTTVRVVAGGVIGGDFFVYGISSGEVTGGFANHVRLFDTAQLLVSDGSIGPNMCLLGQSVATFSGGVASGSIVMLESSQLNATAGTFTTIESNDAATIALSGGGTVWGAASLWDNSRLSINGTIGTEITLRNASSAEISDILLGGTLRTYSAASADVSGGDITRAFTYDSSIITIDDGASLGTVEANDESMITLLDGAVFKKLRAANTSAVYVFGGETTGGIYADHTAAIYIYGSAFNYPFGDITGTTAGFLEGTLANGDSIAAPFFFESDDARIILVEVPVPSALAPLCLGMLWAGRRRRARR